jgi:SH3-like domain-containing protein
MPEVERRAWKAHRGGDPRPITLKAGEWLEVGPEYSGDPDWPGWIQGISADGRKGWIPKSFLEIQGNRARAVRDYTARELEVAPGDGVWVRETYGGWAYCRTADGAWGWTPLRNLDGEE